MLLQLTGCQKWNQVRKIPAGAVLVGRTPVQTIVSLIFSLLVVPQVERPAYLPAHSVLTLTD